MRRHADEHSRQTPSPGTQGEGRGEGSGAETRRIALRRSTPTPTLRRRTGRGGKSVRLSAAAFLISSIILQTSSHCLAGLTQDEVLRSINQNVGEGVDPGKLLASICLIIALIAAIVLLNYRRKRVIVPKVLNHPGKLVKEITRAANLKPAELKRLKVLAEAKDLSSPLLLLLCPSLLQRRTTPDEKTK
ncbi:MAG TPA: hypothetical protein VH518_12830 [Tepidisphaeraceae bacterium]|jgi:hypothetical protein